MTVTAAGYDWRARVRSLRGSDVVRTLGFTLRGERFGPCPSCGADRAGSGSSDRRPPVALSRDGLWHCHRCKAGGDLVALLAYRALHGIPSDFDGWQRLQAIAHGYGWCEAPEERAQRRGRARGQRTAQRRPTAPVELPPMPTSPWVEEEPPAYLDPEELSALWGRLPRVGDVPAAVAYLEGRRIPANRVEDLDLARVLTDDEDDLPAWVTGSWARWTEQNQGAPLLVVPLVDPLGVPRGMLARTTAPDAVNGKSRAVTGYQRRGLVMACPFARNLLANGRPSWWSKASPLRVVVTEGETDFLTLATWWTGADEHAPATLGVFGGSWSPELADRIPEGARVVCRTDDDEAGCKYARGHSNPDEPAAPGSMLGMLSARGVRWSDRPRRWRPERDGAPAVAGWPDENDYIRAFLQARDFAVSEGVAVEQLPELPALWSDDA